MIELVDVADAVAVVVVAAVASMLAVIAALARWALQTASEPRRAIPAPIAAGSCESSQQLPCDSCCPECTSTRCTRTRNSYADAFRLGLPHGMLWAMALTFYFVHHYVI